jgi:glycosyltransferase involved in cell wall biosynthesis
MVGRAATLLGHSGGVGGQWRRLSVFLAHWHSILATYVRLYSRYLNYYYYSLWFGRQSMVERNPEISVVVPLLNEQDNVGPLYEQVTQTLGPEHSYELIFIDDGSTDNSFAVMTELQRADDKVRIIRFRKNFGQTAALSAGFDHARGQIVVAMDGDLQNDPADIPKMLAKLDEGYDVVSGWRKKRHDNAVTRLLPSKAANWLISRLTGVKLHDYGCTLKAYRREVLAQMQLYGEMHRFIPAMASWSGATITEMVVNHRPRTAGVAKYGLGRIRKVVLDLITVKFLGSFSTKPIYVFGGLGMISAVGSILLGLTVIYQKVNFQTDMSGNPLLLLTGVLVIAAIQFILMGLLAELLVRTYHESQGRPTYVIKEIIESSTSEDKEK